MKAFIFLSLALLISCSDDKISNTTEESVNYPVLYDYASLDLYVDILNYRDSLDIVTTYSVLNNPVIQIGDTSYNFFDFTSTEYENYFESSPFPSTVFETDSTISLLFKTSLFLESNHILLENPLHYIKDKIPTRVLVDFRTYKTEININLVGRENTITNNTETKGKERVDAYFIIKEYLNEPLER